LCFRDRDPGNRASIAQALIKFYAPASPGRASPPNIRQTGEVGPGRCVIYRGQIPDTMGGVVNGPLRDVAKLSDTRVDHSVRPVNGPDLGRNFGGAVTSNALNGGFSNHA